MKTKQNCEACPLRIEEKLGAFPIIVIVDLIKFLLKKYIDERNLRCTNAQRG